MIFGAAVHKGFGQAQNLTPLQLEIAQFICLAREGGDVTDDEILSTAMLSFPAATDLDVIRAHAFVQTLGCADIMFPQSTPVPSTTAPAPGSNVFVAQLAPSVRFPPTPTPVPQPAPTPSVPSLPVPTPSFPPPPTSPSFPTSPAVAVIDTRKRDLMIMGGIAVGVLGVLALLFALARKK